MPEYVASESWEIDLDEYPDISYDRKAEAVTSGAALPVKVYDEVEVQEVCHYEESGKDRVVDVSTCEIETSRGTLEVDIDVYMDGDTVRAEFGSRKNGLGHARATRAIKKLGLQVKEYTEEMLEPEDTSST